MENEPSSPDATEEQQSTPAPAPKTSHETVFKYHTRSPKVAMIERITASVLIVSGILFAVIAIASIWGAFGGNGEVVWRSLGSLGVIALTSLVINVGARMMDGRN
jgi:hypothetical protein